MFDARRAYADAVGWIRSARPARIDAGRFAGRAFLAWFAAGVLLLGLIGLLAPEQFGERRARVFGAGWPTYALGAAVALVAVLALAQRRRLRWLFARAREPFVRPLEDHRAFAGAAGALSDCPAPLKTRFALGWVWGPLVPAVAGAMFALSCAYFAVDALLARFMVGPEQILLFVANFVLSLGTFRLAAMRLSTWRVAMSAYRDATGRY